MSNPNEARLPSNIKNLILKILRILIGVFIVILLLNAVLLIVDILTGKGISILSLPIFTIAGTFFLFLIYKAVNSDL